MTNPFFPSIGDARVRQRLARSLTLSDEQLLAECEVDVFLGSGPGGQHRNKTESAVRLRHGPSGLTVCATERRSQLQNKRAALGRLRRRLLEAIQVPKQRQPTKPTRASIQRRLVRKKLLSEKKQSRQKYLSSKNEID